MENEKEEIVDREWTMQDEIDRALKTGDLKYVGKKAKFKKKTNRRKYWRK